MAAADAFAVFIKHIDGERYVGGDLYPYRAIRFDRRITDYFTHQLAGAAAERCPGQSSQIPWGYADGFNDAQEACGPGIGRGGQGGVSQCFNVCGRCAEAVEAAIKVIHAADIENADIFAHQRGIEVEACS